MTPDQLASARAAHWREDAQPILTLDDAKAWLERMQLCLYLPRKSQLLAPAPSFAGAVLGSSHATPPPETLQQAHNYLVRLVAEGFVVPLNLFGTPGEQPDFLVVTTALAQLAALQADRTWKKSPSRTGPGKVSPLAIEIWKLLDREGALTAVEIREHLGHELTEAATIRGLSELWQNLRVAPLPQGDGGPAHWEILAVTHKKEMAKGSTMAQSSALSLLVADYVQSVLAATAEDVEAFLSPVASRSRLRDVLRGLAATRQLKTLSMDAQTFLFVEGTLPDMPEVPTEAAAAEKPAFMGRSAYRERMLNKTKDDSGADSEKTEDTGRGAYQQRRDDSRPDRPRRAGFTDRSSFSDRPRPAADRPSRSGPPRRDFGNREGAPARFGAGDASRPSRPSFGDRARGASTRPPFRKSEGGADRPSTSRPFTPRPFTPREGTRPPFRGRPAAEGERPFRPRTGSDRPRTDERSSRPYTPRAGSRPPFRGKAQAGTDRPFRPRPGAAEGEGRPFTPRPFKSREGAPPPFRDRPADGGDRPFRPRGEGDRPRPAGRSFAPREGSARPPFRGKPSGAGARPFRPRPEGDRPRTDRPRTDSRERPSSGRPSFSREDRGPRREGAGRPRSGEGSSAGRPSRPSGGGFTRREGPASSGRPASGGRPSSGRPGRPSTDRPASGGSSSRGAAGRPSGRPGSRPGTPGRNPGGTGRPGGPRPGSSSPRPGGGRPGGPRPGSSSPRPGGGRPGGSRPGGSRPGGSRPGGSRPSGGRPGSSRPGGMRPPTRKPKKDDA